MNTRKLKNKFKNGMAGLFEVGQQLGVDILPRHFYSEIPNIRQLRKSTDWREPLTMSGIAGAEVGTQLLFVDETTAPYRDGLTRRTVLDKALVMNGSDEGYGVTEADFLYCFIRKYKPAKIVQVGCGVSTAICLMASQDEGYKTSITCVEPYPTAFLKKANEAGEIRLVEKRLQQVYSQIADWISEGDLFFVDSSHALGPAGEVTRIVLDILPNLPTEAFVHFHDIWFPYDYEGGVLNGALFFSHETALLGAFLSMNKHYRIEGSLSMLHHLAQEQLKKSLPTYVPARFIDGINCGEGGDHPTSIYLRT